MSIWLFIACSIISTCCSLDLPSVTRGWNPDDFDSYQQKGNKFSHQNRLYEYILDQNNGFSIDYFGGLIWGHFPYFDADVYQANVHDYQI